MSEQFQHVMVLASIIIGLGITHALLGLSAAIDRLSGPRGHMRLGWAFGLWLTNLFLWMMQFWWWEFRLLKIVKNWSMWNYYLVVIYAVVLFLLVAILIPRRWDEVNDLNDHFLSKRRWFYSFLFVAYAFDVMDSYMKGGWPYIYAGGVLLWIQWIAAFPACIVGFRSTDIRIHAGMAILFSFFSVAIGFDAYSLLGL